MGRRAMVVVVVVQSGEGLARGVEGPYCDFTFLIKV